MAIFLLEKADNFYDACADLAATLLQVSRSPSEHALWKKEIPPCDLSALLVRVRGLERIFFKSRDCDFEFVGFGAADKVFEESSPPTALHALVVKAESLHDDQFYFGALRFDEAAEIADEWKDFGKRLFILPLITVIKRDNRYFLCVNFRIDGHIVWPLWRDQASTLLRTLVHEEPVATVRSRYSSNNYLPEKDHYAANIHRALNTFVDSKSHKKVVIGRRNCISFHSAADPAHLFCTLRRISRDAFLFFLDSGFESAFLGVSPELLYRRTNQCLETESLAGTRARAHDEANDDRLRSELLKSLKDNQEHALVSMHIEEKLKEFGTTDLSASKLEIMALPFVQHLLKRYRGVIDDSVNDASILRALHPTPAVCGLDIDWAKNFIRTYEGFDRGFYAGPIGYIAKDHAEFAVAIRSALFERDNFYVYAACGIVPGSLHNQEWEELNNKEKTILSIFDKEK